ncbi:MAG: nucleotidyltransferase domain-containing protein [Candidatus Edwardsbacteria bacterium]
MDPRIKEIEREIVKVASKFKPKEIWLFGSIIEDGFEKAKDIDIAVKGVEKDFFKLYGRLIWILEGKFRKTVDLVPVDWLKEKKLFLKYVRKGSRLI